MNSIKYIVNQHIKLAALVAMGLGLAACSVNNNDTSDEVTDADLEMAAQIMGESLSGQNGGVISSVYDATADISNEGMGYKSQAFKSSGTHPSVQNDSSGRGGESGWSYSYDPETGTHTIEFFRSVTRGAFGKSVEAKYQYIFRNPEGTFIQYPRINKDSVETEDFFGYRSGTVQSPRRNSTFNRTDTLYFGGLGDASDIVSLYGNHHGEGEFTSTRISDEQIKRTYVVDAEFIDIQIEKAAVLANDRLERGVTGTINYTIELTKTTGAGERSATIEGTIEMNGDGTALLRFKKHNRFFLVDLIDGDVEERS